MTAAIKVAIADDQALVRHGLHALIEGLGGIEVAIDAEDGEQLLEALSRERVDVILADIRMPRCSGIEMVRRLRARGDLTPTILLTTFDESTLLNGGVKAGAQGFLLKGAAPMELKTAIESVAAGATLFSPATLQRLREVTPAAADIAARLTERELSILRIVAGGYSNKEIGRLLGISDGTVKNHLTAILLKLDARDRTHAVIKAISNGLM